MADAVAGVARVVLRVVRGEAFELLGLGGRGVVVLLGEEVPGGGGGESCQGEGKGRKAVRGKGKESCQGKGKGSCQGEGEGKLSGVKERGKETCQG